MAHLITELNGITQMMYKSEKEIEIQKKRKRKSFFSTFIS